MRQVFDDSDIYCWFEPRDGSLRCVYATAPGYLLGESVRNWLHETMQSRNFVYCERMGDQRAVVLVVDGQVVKDALLGGYELTVELRHAIARLEKVAPDAHDIFLRGIAADDLPPARRSHATSVEDSVLDWMEDVSGPLPELKPMNQAIGGIDVVAKRLRQLKIVRSIGLVAGSVAIAVLAGYWWLNRPPPEEVLGAPPPKPPGVLSAEYSALLRTPDPGVLIPAMYRAHRTFLSDPFFGELMDVRKLQWTRTDGRLKVEASLPRDVAEGPRLEPPDGLVDQIRGRAAMREWGVEFGGLDVTFSLPVTAANRVDPPRLPQPLAEGNPWHEKRLGTDLEALGTVTVRPGTRNRVYRAYSTLLALRDAEWYTGGTAAWLGNRLAGGPLVLDSVVLESGSGAAMDGEVQFTTLWCATVDESTRRCAAENP